MRRKQSLRASYAQKCREEAARVIKARQPRIWKHRKPIKKVSKSQRRRLGEYFTLRIDYLKRFPVCGICLCLNEHPAPSTEVHHKFGRNASLLCDEPKTIA